MPRLVYILQKKNSWFVVIKTVLYVNVQSFEVKLKIIESKCISASKNISEILHFYELHERVKHLADVQYVIQLCISDSVSCCESHL
jgi:hypothetical protein